jgi:hypothetical protein
MDKIKVLWMNNGDESLWSFVTNSNLQKLNIVVCNTTKECKNKLHKDNWDAIILNAEPKRMETEIPQIKNLRDVYIDLLKVCNSPIFVVTANESIKRIDKGLARNLSGNRFYELQKSSSQLYEDIKEEVQSNEDFQIRKKYEEIYDFYLSIEDSKSDSLLMKLLKGLYTNDFDKDPLVPANVRLVLDKVMTYLTNEGILQEAKFNGSNLSECSTELGRKSNIVPCHVQRCFHSCVVIANNGNHQIPEETEKSYKNRIGNPLFVHRQITSCQAPYLNKALVYDLLNILYWCATINKSRNEK